MPTPRGTNAFLSNNGDPVPVLSSKVSLAKAISFLLIGVTLIGASDGKNSSVASDIGTDSSKIYQLKSRRKAISARLDAYVSTLDQHSEP